MALNSFDPTEQVSIEAKAVTDEAVQNKEYKTAVEVESSIEDESLRTQQVLRAGLKPEDIIPPTQSSKSFDAKEHASLVPVSEEGTQANSVTPKDLTDLRDLLGKQRKTLSTLQFFLIGGFVVMFIGIVGFLRDAYQFHSETLESYTSEIARLKADNDALRLRFYEAKVDSLAERLTRIESGKAKR
jgi:hypothetical protein